MPRDFRERADRVQRACSRVLGTSDAVFIPYIDGAAQAPIDVRGVWDDDYRRVELLDGVAQESSSPAMGAVRMRSDDPLVDGTPVDPQPKQGDHFVVYGVEFEVVEAQPDGQGDVMSRFGEV